MISASACWDQRCTWYGCGGSASLIDHVCIPAALAGTVRSAGCLMSMGRRLQVIQSACKCDHVPVHCTFMYVKQHVEKKKEDAGEWDRDALMRGVLSGEGRMEMLEELEAEAEAMMRDVAFDAMEAEATPDKLCERVDQLIMK
eukprot:8179630-Lingulodinium_polyedra.AAC.1